MAVIETLYEYSTAQVSGGVIFGVKIAGLRSRNGRDYPMDTLIAAHHLYEDAPVYLLHGSSRQKRDNSRKHEEHFGSLKNVHTRATGIFGDLHVKQSHPMAGAVLMADGSKFGLSHNVRAEMTEDRKTVTEIISVNSVDLVDNPATTNNLFEEEDMDLAELVAANEAQAAEIATLKEGQGQILTLLEGLQPPEPPKPEKKKRIAVLQEAADVDPDAPAPMGNTHDDFLGVLRGFATHATKGANA
jgi:hypothetical protein